ncbi:MAG TPA: hypothetical protein VLG50_04960 [Candidatus Saccharimonadales bacterium]|nr:hypothetical protein [Candidatus Saccharimonadales bacterium]
MNWNEYQTYHKKTHGTTSKQQLSSDYRKYKLAPGPAKSASSMRPRREASYSKVLSSLPSSRRQKRTQLKKVMQRKSEGRGSKTRSWAARSPQRGTERHTLLNQCGAKAFLDAENEKYPVMSALRTGDGCQYNCKGLQSAYIRARQYHNEPIATKAKGLLAQHCQ